MKKTQVAILLVLVFVLLVAGCELSPLSKPLVVVNDSDANITTVYIQEYIVSPRVVRMPNALLNDEVIAPGARKTFYLAPYSSAGPDGLVFLSIGEVQVDFSFDFIIDDHNERILATYDGIDITLTGSNATPSVT